jgi:hypothetical protein
LNRYSAAVEATATPSGDDEMLLAISSPAGSVRV